MRAITCLLLSAQLFIARSLRPTIKYHRRSPPLLDSVHAAPGDKMKLGVLLLNLGGPEAMKDVEGFLYNLFADPDIIRLPPIVSILQKPIAWAIAKRRAPKSSVAYESIGGGSPIVKYTGAQAQLLQTALSEKGYDAQCYFAMRYWHPFTEETLAQIQKDQINTLVIVPLYPQYSISTSGSSLRVLQEIFQKNPLLWGSDKVSHTG
jgi:protoporphyrin/coproporphyrin ferrochelatase